MPNEIMLARLKAYSLIKTQNTTLFLDADSLVIKKLKLPDFNKFRACLVRRDDQTSILNHNYPEYYPEFLNQKMIDIMPILFGLIITPDGGKLFDELFKNALKLPDRFHRWYGDQMAIAQEWIKNKENYLLLKQEEYLFVTRTSLKKAQLENDREKLDDVKIAIERFRSDVAKFKQAEVVPLQTNSKKTSGQTTVR